jgi:hypothetical protein
LPGLQHPFRGLGKIRGKDSSHLFGLSGQKWSSGKLFAAWLRSCVTDHGVDSVIRVFGGEIVNVLSIFMGH